MEFWREARRRGLSEFLAANARFAIGDAIARRFDRRYAVDTSGEIERMFLEVVGGHRRQGHDFMSTPPLTLRRALDSLPKDLSAFTFIDIGCGKGRVILLAATRNFRRVIGVEDAPELVAIAKRNIETWRGPRRCNDVTAVCADAVTFELPPEPCVLYLFGPFADKTSLAEIISKFGASLRALPRRMYLLYLDAKEQEPPDRAMRAAGFERLTDKVLRYDPGATRSPVWYALYGSCTGRTSGSAASS